MSDGQDLNVELCRRERKGSRAGGQHTIQGGLVTSSTYTTRPHCSHPHRSHSRRSHPYSESSRHCSGSSHRRSLHYLQKWHGSAPAFVIGHRSVDSPPNPPLEETYPYDILIELWSVCLESGVGGT